MQQSPPTSRQRGEHITKNSSGVRIAKALSHPLRMRILMSMHAPIRRLSASVFADENEVGLSHASYHFRKLDEAYGCIEIVDRIQRRGAWENVYLPVERAMAWTREWEDLGPAVRQSISSTALGGACRLIGEAIDSGTFEGLPDPVMAWDAMEVDETGYAEAHDIVERALTELLAVSKRCRERIAEDPETDTSLMSYLLSTFESPESVVIEKKSI